VPRPVSRSLKVIITPYAWCISCECFHAAMVCQLDCRSVLLCHSYLRSVTLILFQSVIKKKYGQDAVNVGDEGGFAPNIQVNDDF